MGGFSCNRTCRVWSNVRRRLRVWKVGSADVGLGCFSVNPFKCFRDVVTGASKQASRHRSCGSKWCCTTTFVSCRFCPSCQRCCSFTGARFPSLLLGIFVSFHFMLLFDGFHHHEQALQTSFLTAKVKPLYTKICADQDLPLSGGALFLALYKATELLNNECLLYCVFFKFMMDASLLARVVQSHAEVLTLVIDKEIEEERYAEKKKAQKLGGFRAV